MNKKILGVKLSTYLTVLLCLIAAFVIWLIFNLPDSLNAEEATSFIGQASRFL